MSMGPREPLSTPQPSYCSHHHSKHAIPFCSYISYSSVQPLPPTGHPEACWNTMPVLAQAPTSGSNVEVTSLEKNGIVSVKSSTLSKHSTAKKTNAEFRSKQNFSSNKQLCKDVATWHAMEHITGWRKFIQDCINNHMVCWRVSSSVIMYNIMYCKNNH